MNRLTELTLEAVGCLSQMLADGESIGDAYKLSAIVTACRIIEAKALPGTIDFTIEELEQAENEAKQALGW